MTWLGDNNPFTERFPTCDLNEAQVRTLVGFSQIRVSGLGPGEAIRKLTESGIVEISVRWDRTMNGHGSGGTLWLAGDGEYIAAEVWEGSHFSDAGPIKVYRWRPNVVRWRLDAEAEQVTYDRSDGHKGAIKQTRHFIRTTWDLPDTSAVHNPIAS